VLEQALSCDTPLLSVSDPSPLPPWKGKDDRDRAFSASLRSPLLVGPPHPPSSLLSLFSLSGAQGLPHAALMPCVPASHFTAKVVPLLLFSDRTTSFGCSLFQPPLLSLLNAASFGGPARPFVLFGERSELQLFSLWGLRAPPARGRRQFPQDRKQDPDIFSFFLSPSRLRRGLEQKEGFSRKIFPSCDRSAPLE